MNVERATEIVESLGVIEVQHQGEPVWIEEIEGDDVIVRYLDSQKRSKVKLTELDENKNPELLE